MSSVAVLQFGTGVLLRGYFDWMLQQAKNSKKWNGYVIGVKLTSRGSFPLAQQPSHPHTTRGVLDGKVVDETSTIDVVSRWVNPYEWAGLADFLASAAIPELEVVVSNSTEAGLSYTEIPRPEKGECPESFPAKLLMWLKARFDANSNLSATVLPTELVEHNGKKLKEIVKRHASDWKLGSEFDAWLEAKCDFRSTLVDRIVTKPGEGDDPLLTISEPYHLLAIEGDDALEDKLPLKASGVNVVYTDDLALYRSRKVSVLNGAHHTIVFLGLAMGKGNVLQCTQDAVLHKFLQGVILSEVLPILDGDEEELKRYAAAILERFSNPFLDHRLEAIAMNSAAKVPVRLLPSITAHQTKTGKLPPGLVLAIAVFLMYDGEVQGCEKQPVLDACSAVPGLHEVVEAALVCLKSSGPEASIRSTGLLN